VSDHKVYRIGHTQPFSNICRVPPAPGTCGIGGKLVDFADLSPTLTLTTDTGGDITNFMGNWHGLSIHGFYGVWNAPNATLVIPNAARCAADLFVREAVMTGSPPAETASELCGKHPSGS